MKGNVVLRLFEVDHQLLCGLFIGRAELRCHKGADDFVLRAGEPLRFGIDFIPSILEVDRMALDRIRGTTQRRRQGRRRISHGA
jgi:hypothetical protein